MDEIQIRFTEHEVAKILWAVRPGRIPVARYRRAMAERVKVTEAVRRTGVPGTVIFLAIRHREITSERDDRGYDWVDPDEVSSLAVPL